MKKLLLFFYFSIFAIFINAQNGFEWDKRFDSDKSKDDLFALGKMFVAEAWNSAQDVTQNADKEAGVILIKAVEPFVARANNFYNAEYYIRYTVKLYFKDKRYRIVIDGLDCTKIIVGNNVFLKGEKTLFGGWPMYPFLEEYPESKGLKKTGMKKKDYDELTANIKGFFNTLVMEFEKSMQQENLDEDW